MFPTESQFKDDDSVSEFAELLQAACHNKFKSGTWQDPLPPGQYNVDCCPLEAFDYDCLLAPGILEILTVSEQLSFKCGYDQTNIQWVTCEGVKLDRRFYNLGKVFREQALNEGF